MKQRSYRKLAIICVSFIAWRAIDADSNEFEEDNDCPVIVQRSQWNARQRECISYQVFPIRNVIIMATMTDVGCTSFADCREYVRKLQNYQMDTMNKCDIEYTFLIAEDGLIFEGVGWHKTGSHTNGYNLRSIGVAFIGKFSYKLPSAEALNSFWSLLSCAVEMGELHEDYKVFAKRQFEPRSENPGNAFFKFIKKIDGWSNELYDVEDGNEVFWEQ